MDRIQVLTPEESAEFKRCRRAWDLGAGTRRGLEPIDSQERIEADRWMRDALAVYYFPGMWDWSRTVVLPLVTCRFRAPCEALYAGEDAGAILGEQYRRRSEVAPVQGRLGGVTWSTGRGAAPPRFPGDLG